MTHLSRRWHLFTSGVALLLIWTSCAYRSPHVETSASRVVANLHAFARLYGIVRWFHPSDAASVIDWERFATEGSRRILAASDRHALREVISALFRPIAPTVEIAETNEPLRLQPTVQLNANRDLDVVAWQHEGYGDTNASAEYRSKRRHRSREVPAQVSNTSLPLVHTLPAEPFRGKMIRFHGKLRAGHHGEARIWLRVDRSEGVGFFDNMINRPVTTDTWTRAEITGVVAPDAMQIAFGVLVLGRGTTWYDDFELSVQGSDGSWTRIEFPGGRFDDSTALTNWQLGIGGPSFSYSTQGWLIAIDRDHPAEGAGALRISHATSVLTQELFEAMPAPGEAVEVDLGDHLRARVPIALLSRDGRTIGDDPDAARVSQATAMLAVSGYDVYAGVADVIVLWNVLEHFWPYWNSDTHASWSNELDTALAEALRDRSVANHVATLERLTAKTPDGHVSVTCRGEPKYSYLPLAIELVEGRLVVVASDEGSITPGDVLVDIDGRPARELLEEAESTISGSTQWRRVRGLRRLGRGMHGSVASLTVERDGSRIAVQTMRSDRAASPRASHPPIDRLDDGVYYVDLHRATGTAIDAVMDRLASAPGVVFDVREYPNDHQFLSHLLTASDTANAWQAIPRIIRPDSPATPASWKFEGWEMPMLAPRIQGRVAFLTGPGAISYAESVMGIVEHYHLGAIVGSPTAGSNGNVAGVYEPTGCTVDLTGMLVTKLDGSRHYLVGIQPTIPAARTIAGIRAGRDEVLERALAYVRGKE